MRRSHEARPRDVVIMKRPQQHTHGNMTSSSRSLHPNQSKSKMKMKRETASSLYACMITEPPNRKKRKKRKIWKTEKWRNGESGRLSLTGLTIDHPTSLPHGTLVVPTTNSPKNPSYSSPSIDPRLSKLDPRSIRFPFSPSAAAAAAPSPSIC